MIFLPICIYFNGFYNFSFLQYNIDGTIYSGNTGGPVYNTTPFVQQQCCKVLNGTPSLYEVYENKTLTNAGYICCDKTNKCGCIIGCSWSASTGMYVDDNGNRYILFVKPDGSYVVTTPDGCNCISGYSQKVQITDPFTHQVGYGCQLTPSGVNDILNNGSNGIVYNHYKNKSTAYSNTHNPNVCF